MQGATRNPLAEPGHPRHQRRARRSRSCVAISFLGVGSTAGVHGVRARSAPAVTAVLVFALGAIGPRRPSAGQARARRRGADRRCSSRSRARCSSSTRETLDEFRFWIVGLDRRARRRRRARGAAGHRRRPGDRARRRAASLNALALGDDVARALGQHVGRARAVAGLGFVLLAGGAVAAAGPIAFVGLAVPHIARGVVGARLPLDRSRTAIVLGAVLLLAGDVARPRRSRGRPSSASASSPRWSARRSSSGSSAAGSWWRCEPAASRSGAARTRCASTLRPLAVTAALARRDAARAGR